MPVSDGYTGGCAVLKFKAQNGEKKFCEIRQKIITSIVTFH